MPDLAPRWKRKGRLPSVLKSVKLCDGSLSIDLPGKKGTEVPATARNVYRASECNLLKKSVLADSSYGTFDHAVWGLMVRSLCGVEPVRVRVCVYRQQVPFVHAA
jgi:hypothetical protein